VVINNEEVDNTQVLFSAVMNKNYETVKKLIEKEQK